MGLQGRYFGRWVLPVFPILCLLAAYFALLCAEALARRLASGAEDPAARAGRGARGLRAGLIAVVTLALCAQGLVYSIHSDRVLARADTRALTRAWMVAHIPAGTPIVVEPVAPDGWATRWRKYNSLVSQISAGGALTPDATHVVGIEEYERTLAPALLGYYRRHGYCFVVRGSTQSGRAFADPQGGAAGARLLPRARAPGRDRATPPRRIRAGRARSRSASTGASTTTRSPTTGPGPR